jgi:hypothetical protein
LALLLGIVAAAGVAVAMAGPPGSWLRALPVLDRIRYPAKALAWTFFALPMLAALGADALRFDRSRKRAGLLVAAGLAGLCLLLFSRQSPGARLAEALGLAALLLLALPGRAASAPSARRFAALETVAALGLVAALFLAGGSVFRFAPESEIRRVAPSVAFLSRVSGRVLTPPGERLVPWVLRDARFDAATLRRQRESLLGYTNLLAGVPVVRTAAALSTEAERRILASIDEGSNPVLAGGAAAARVLWTPFAPPEMGSRKVGDFFRAPINPYRSRLSLVPAYRVEPDRARAWERAAKGETDWSREVFLDREPDPRPAAGAKRSFVVARIAMDLAERVAADVNSDAAGILVLADLHYPGWTASVDGRPAPILAADGYLRAVALSPGAHRVEFRYRPVSFYAGAALSLLALAALAVNILRGPGPARGSAA